MTKMTQGSAATCDAETFAVEAAEADFTLAVQCESQRLLNDKGLRARDLARRLNVTEARVSQMFGDQAKNLTIKTIARIYYHLGETAHITSLREFESLTSAHVEHGDDRWTVSGLVHDVEVPSNITIDGPHGEGASVAGRFLDSWVRAESAEEIKPRRFATVR